MTVLDIVKMSCTKEGESISDFEYAIAVDEAAVEIKNYCNLTGDIPDGLKYTWANMAIDLVLYRHYRTKETLGDDGQRGLESRPIASMSIGDTSVTFGTTNSSDGLYIEAKSHVANLDDLLMNYKDQLNKYRKMVW